MRKFEKLLYLFTILIISAIFIIVMRNYNISKKQQKISKENQEHVFYEPEYNSEYIKNINTISLENDAIKNKYQFVYFSDLHISQVNENEPNEQIKSNLYERNKGFWGDEDSTLSRNTFKEIINYTNNKNANALLLNGDIVDSPADSSMAVLRENLNNLKVDYLYMLGNHDWSFLWDYHTENTKKEQLPKFKEFMDDTDVSYLEYEDLIILAINDSTDQIPESSLSKIKKVLEKKKPTIVMMHVPISTPSIATKSEEVRNRVSAVGNGGIEPTESTRMAIDMILSDEYKVFYVLGAHIHFHLEDNLNENVHEYITDTGFNGIKVKKFINILELIIKVKNILIF